MIQQPQVATADELIAQFSVGTLDRILKEIPDEPRFAIGRGKVDQAMTVLTVDMPMDVRA